MMDIHPQHVTLSGLLGNRLFRIPAYQRSYSWRSKQREDLFDDIEALVQTDPGRTHFMATMVGLRRESKLIGTDNFTVIEVVDGQQRLTTLIILLRCIVNRLANATAAEEKIRAELLGLLVKGDSASLLLLQTNHDSSSYFAEFLRNGTHPKPSAAMVLADRELLLAMEECEEFVAKWVKSGRSMSDLVVILKNRLTVIFHEIADEGMVYSVFEVLNSRGLIVSWFDRLKSMLMRVVFDNNKGNHNELIHEIHELWADIYKTVGLKMGQSTESLRFAATLRQRERPSRPLSEEAAVESLLAECGSDVAKAIELTRWVKRVTEAVNDVVQDVRIDGVTSIAQARLVATAIHLRDDWDDTSKTKALRLWENVSFRVYGMFRKDARTGVGEYVRLAWDISQGKASLQSVLEGLARIGREYRIDAAISELRGKDCYNGWQKELRYFFSRYEEHLATQRGVQFDNLQWQQVWASRASDSIEHILPQSGNQDSMVHRLGNLLVLPPKLNTALGNKAPVKKAPSYVSSGFLAAAEVAPRLGKWNAAAIRAREEELLAWAALAWRDEV